MIPDYSTGINGGSQGKLASFIDLVILNMALDHSHINLPLTNRANDAHPKRCLERREIHPFHFIFLLLLPCVVLLVSSPAPTHLTFLICLPLLPCNHHLLLLSLTPIFLPRSSTVPGPPDRRPLWCNAGSQAWSTDTTRKMTEETLTE